MKNKLLPLLLFIILSCDVLPPNSVYRSPGNFPVNPSATSEKGEFAILLEKDLLNKKRVNAEVLTYLLNDSDPTETHTATVITNSSRCDIIVRMVGISNNVIYNLPISGNSKNQFVIKKGNYTLRSNICGATYYSQKNIADPLILTLSNN